ncbi:MAG: hypothetical protein R3A13_05145 [Bdellovibrionota bacterium]
MNFTNVFKIPQDALCQGLGSVIKGRTDTIKLLIASNCWLMVSVLLRRLSRLWEKLR